MLSWVPYCGQCLYCLSGHPNLCRVAYAAMAQGTLLDGTSRLSRSGKPIYHYSFISSFAEYTVVPEPGCVVIRPDLPLDKAALVGCAVMTGVGAVLNTARVQPSSTVAVVGAGGVGLNVIQAASLSGAYPIIAIDIRSEKIALARTFGASHGINSREQDAIATVQEITEYGVDWAFEVIGNPRTIEQAWELIRPGGTVVVVGLAPKGSKVSLPAFDFISEKNIRGCFLLQSSSDTPFGLPPFVCIWKEFPRLQGLII